MQDTSTNLVEAGNNSEKRRIMNKCWICKTQEHWTNECQKFLALCYEDRNSIVQENHACFSCLKRTGKEHNLNTCRPRKQCTATENGVHCEQYHHLLLHKTTENNVRASISSKTEKSEVLLPVISANVCGRSGL